MKTRLIVLALGLVVSGVTAASAQTTWSQFRGASAGVVADDPALPDTWGPDENVIWDLDVPGHSWSSPIVWDSHVFILTVVTAEGEEIRLQPVE